MGTSYRSPIRKTAGLLAKGGCCIGAVVVVAGDDVDTLKSADGRELSARSRAAAVSRDVFTDSGVNG